MRRVLWEAESRQSPPHVNQLYAPYSEAVPGVRNSCLMGIGVLSLCQPQLSTANFLLRGSLSKHSCGCLGSVNNDNIEIREAQSTVCTGRSIS
jgi:hypothetical protein